MWPKPLTQVILQRPRVINYPPVQKPEPVQSPTERVSCWISEAPSKPTPLPSPSIRDSEIVEELKREYNNSYRPRTHSAQTSVITSAYSSQLELKLDELKAPLDNIRKKALFEKQEKERIGAVQKQWTIKGLPNPDEWPRLKFIQNYDEDPKLQKAAVKVENDFKQFKHRGWKAEDSDEYENDEDNTHGKSNKEAWAIIKECSSKDDRFEAAEMIEYRNHDWCVALKICREKMGKKSEYQLLVYSSQCGIQRLLLTSQQINAIGETLLIKYKVNQEGVIEVLPIHSALPSTGLLSLKYRNNKGIELRVYGIVNFIDLEKDRDQLQHRTIIWTDALGPIYLTAADRSNIRRKLMMQEYKIFAPLRICQLVVKGDFASDVLDGTFLKWKITSFTPLVEETPKDPNIGRNLWPARVIRLDDLVKEIKKNPSQSSTRRHFYLPSTGTWLKSISEKGIRVFAGTHLNGIINSAGRNYAEKGVMMAFVIPYFHQNKFVYYEALIAGPPRVVMMMTEGRFLNYAPKTFSLPVQKMYNEYAKRRERKEVVRNPPTTMRQPEYRLKSRSGFEEFHFDFQNTSVPFYKSSLE